MLQSLAHIESNLAYILDARDGKRFRYFARISSQSHDFYLTIDDIFVMHNTLTEIEWRHLGENSVN